MALRHPAFLRGSEGGEGGKGGEKGAGSSLVPNENLTYQGSNILKHSNRSFHCLVSKLESFNPVAVLVGREGGVGCFCSFFLLNDC